MHDNTASAVVRRRVRGVHWWRQVKLKKGKKRLRWVSAQCCRCQQTENPSWIVKHRFWMMYLQDVRSPCGSYELFRKSRATLYSTGFGSLLMRKLDLRIFALVRRQVKVSWNYNSLQVKQFWALGFLIQPLPKEAGSSSLAAHNGMLDLGLDKASEKLVLQSRLPKRRRHCCQTFERSPDNRFWPYHIYYNWLYVYNHVLFGIDVCISRQKVNGMFKWTTLPSQKSCLWNCVLLSLGSLTALVCGNARSLPK